MLGWISRPSFLFKIVRLSGALRENPTSTHFYAIHYSRDTPVNQAGTGRNLDFFGISQNVQSSSANCSILFSKTVVYYGWMSGTHALSRRILRESSEADASSTAWARRPERDSGPFLSSGPHSTCVAAAGTCSKKRDGALKAGRRPCFAMGILRAHIIQKEKRGKQGEKCILLAAFGRK